jgi:hypothetical protein
MPRYWFNVRDGDDLISDDPKGCELPNLEAVKKDVVRCARQILCAAALRGTAGSLQIQIEAVDEAGDTVLIMPVGHATGSESQT